MSFVDGIGGAFIFSNDPKELAVWYGKALGITVDGVSDGAPFKTFSFRDIADPSLKKTTTWAIMKAKQEIDGKVRTGYINYRVHSLDSILAHLSNLEIIPHMTEDYDFGRFAQIKDPEGNTVELFEEFPVKV